jgi:cellulose synthase/poly-beta-1,6-N-acetylglucosamine synthase-like glycosyltransferase
MRKWDVSAPSICDSNGDSSWAARGRLYAEAIMHGPLQAGYSSGFAPLCIGSHYTVRTKALKEIGGLGSELAEDHSTTLMMNGHGWKGIHAMDALAHGEGPPSLGDCITQEFQWSRSLMVLLLTEMPKYWGKLKPKLKLKFLFAQLWYPLFGLFMVAGHLLPILAVCLGEPFVSVSFLEFIKYSLPVTVSIMGVIWFLKTNGWLKPGYSPKGRLWNRHSACQS